ncbi:MAG TPA: hypothetical protein DCP98_02310 [Sphaerochaeta sp.]|nr:hypothetical protein [Sphaerochaeta sp.]
MIERDLTLLTAKELTDCLASCRGVIVPIASIEQCGAHGATGIDFHVARRIARELSGLCDMLYAPVIPYGDALEMADFPGTVNIPTETLGSYYHAVAKSFFRTGAKVVVFLASHSLNCRAADLTCRRLYAEGHNALVVDFWKSCSQVSRDLLSDKRFGTGHGAEQISSVSMAVNAALIRREKAVNEEPKADFVRRVAHIYGGSNVCTSYSNFHDYCESGSWGDISEASAEKGELILGKALSLISEAVLDAVGGD